MRLLAAALILPFCALAQDTRNVVEPSIPPACATLKAQIGRAGRSIAFEDESHLDTARIQAAIDSCAAGGPISSSAQPPPEPVAARAVVLQRASSRLDAFLSGPLQLRSGVILVVDRDTWLFASRNPRDYDRTPGVCGTITQDGHGCKALINGEGVRNSGVMGDGMIDGRGGEVMLGQKISWWNLADQARKGGNQNNPRLLILNHCDNFTLYRITLMNSPNFHVSYSNGKGFTVWGVKIWAPERARNTDGIDPGNSTDVTITRSFIHTGDDHVAIKAPEGAPTAHISVTHNHFYAGHGMSIGSPTAGGASAILVSDLSIDGADNGIRIKSNITRGGLVHDVTYQDVCIRNTADPIVMDTAYSAQASKDDNTPPVFRDIRLRNVRIEGGGKVILEGLDAQHRLDIAFDNVVFDNPGRVRVTASHADVSAGPGAFNLRISGEDVSFRDRAGSSIPNSCAGKLAPFPLW